MTTGYEDDVIPVDGMSPEDLHAEALARQASSAGLRASEKQYKRIAYEEGRAADQCAHEAALLEAAAAALAAFRAEDGKTAGIEAAAEGAVAAGRAAEDRVRRAKRNLARRRAESQRTENDKHADPSALDEAAVRVHSAEATLQREKDAQLAELGRQQRAEQALDTHQQGVRELESAWSAAAWRASHPGEAPRTGPVPFGAVTAADMTDEERQLMTGWTMMAAMSGRDTAPASLTRAELMRDQTKMRALNRHVIIPPRMP